MKSVSDRLGRHFAACAVVVAAAAVTSGSEAAIVYSGLQNIAAPATSQGVYLNLITGANGIAPVAGWHINPWGSTGLRFGTNYPTPDTFFVGLTPATSSSSGGTAANLALGSSIKLNGTSTAGASSMNAAYGWSFSGNAASFGTATGQWKLNSDNYLGVLAFEGGGSVLKAWVRINVGATNLQRTIVDWGYELNGGDLAVGAVPAPGALALLGAAGLMGRRRRN